MEENYDDMSNEQLRLKLLECGFTNMPVTSTTRKVLIKKLKNHMNGTTKVRRETMHVTKYSSDDDSEPLGIPSNKKKSTVKKDSANRRATVGGALTKLPKPVSTPQQANKLPAVISVPEVMPSLQQSDTASASKRRSGRITPIKEKGATDGLMKAVLPQEPTILEDSDDDMIPLTQLKHRKSKSPSLSRADMLTTSYIHQVEVNKGPSVEPIVEEMDIDMPEPEKEEMETIILDDYDDSEQETMPPPPQPTLPKPVARDSFYSTTMSQFNTRTNYTAPDRKGYEEPSIGPSVVKHGDTAVPRQKTKITTPSHLSMATTFRDETGPRYNPTDSPYLSDFTKRLSRLRAETSQLPTGVGNMQLPTKRTTMLQENIFEDSSATVTSAYIRRKDANEASSSSHRTPEGEKLSPFTKKWNDIVASVRQVLLVLDQRYSIWKKFYCIAILLLIIFLFVIFFM